MSGRVDSSIGPAIEVDSHPLAGVLVGITGDDLPTTIAARLLSQLGARIAVDPAGHVPSARLVGPAVGDLPGLPAGTVAYAAGIGLAAAGVLAVVSGGEVCVDERELAVQLVLPAVIAAEYGTRHRAPAPPRRIGSGYLASDIATPDDEAAFTRLLDVLGPKATTAEIADEAQSWRLPVCEYRHRPAEPAPVRVPASRRAPTDSTPPPPEQTGVRPPLAGFTVCDLTAMWAGPLATWLMAAAGADVHKIEPSARLDGMRGLDGGGIHPPGADPSLGTASGMFNALNRGKRRHDLDLRNTDDRSAFEALVATSDLVIDNFSRRVMPNLGLEPEQLRRIRPSVSTVSMPAFPADHPWQVALGPGIHAAARLGDLGNGRFAAPTVAYPDALGGLTAFTVAVALLHGARRTGIGGHGEVSLFGAAASLARVGHPSPILRARDPHLGQRLLDDPALTRAGSWETIDDRAGRHRYPRSPFRGSWAPAALGAAPPLRTKVSAP